MVCRGLLRSAEVFRGLHGAAEVHWGQQWSAGVR